MAGYWHEHQIRERAYAIWEREGCPHGMEQQHWAEAEAEIKAEEDEVKEAEKLKLDE